MIGVYCEKHNWYHRWKNCPECYKESYRDICNMITCKKITSLSRQKTRLSRSRNMNDNELRELESEFNDLSKKEIITIEDLKKQIGIADNLAPYRCVKCFKIIFYAEKHINDEYGRYHPECFEQLQKERKHFKNVREEEEKRKKERMHAIEHSLKPKIWQELLWFHGLKKDRDAFMKEVKELMKKHSLN